MSIESLVLGQEYINNNITNNNTNIHNNVIDKLDIVIKQMSSLDEQLPILNQCRDIASKLRPYILQGHYYLLILL